MAQITDISPQVKDKERVNVYVDGRFYCGMKLETVLACRLKAGMHIEPAQLDEIQLKNECSQAFDRALTHLSASMKTEKQMCDYLKKKGYVESVCRHVLEKLRGYAFVNDEEYCAQYVQTAGKDMGARRIVFELRKRGAREECIESALASLEGEEDAARRAAEKFMKNRPHTRENLAKAFRHLMSRGFGADISRDVLSALGGEEEELP